MTALSWPQQRTNPLRAFTPYRGGFNALDPDYLAVRRLRRASHWLRLTRVGAP